MFNKFKIGDYVVRNVHGKTGAQQIIEIKYSRVSRFLVFANDQEKGLAVFYRFATEGEIKRAKVKNVFNR